MRVLRHPLPIGRRASVIKGIHATSSDIIASNHRQAIIVQKVTTPRSIAAIVPAAVSRHGEGLRTQDLAASRMNVDIAPFIVVSFYEMNGPTFPPHPHAGFSVATYIVPESRNGFVNQDSLGHRNRIPPGALHWTTAGAGVLHEEQPERAGAPAHGFQIWIDLPDAERECAPDARHLPAADVPVSHTDGTTIRAVLGASNGLRSPLATPTPVRLVDVVLAPAATFVQALGSDENAFAFVLGGELITPGGTARAGEAAVTVVQGDGLIWHAGTQGARFLLFAGVPQSKRRVQQGPFIARDQQQLAGFVAAFNRGGFGQIVAFADAPFREDA
jgi:redox-sensitive bicupin YhaK (pirin superfamily)